MNDIAARARPFILRVEGHRPTLHDEEHERSSAIGIASLPESASAEKRATPAHHSPDSTARRASGTAAPQSAHLRAMIRLNAAISGEASPIRWLMMIGDETASASSR